MFGLTLFQGMEEALLGRIEDYCLDRLLDRLWVPPLHEQVEAAITRSMASLPRHLAEEIRRQAERGG